MKLCITVAALAAIPALSAQAVPWTLGQWNVNPANGHYYSVQQITGGTTGWLIARAQAQALSAPNGAAADLATLTSAAEDAFAFAGIDSAAYWNIDSAGNNEGPNLGGLQTNKLAEPAGNWAWVSGEPWSYTQWNPGEPSNQSNIEDYLTFFSTGSGRTGNWNDIGSGTSAFGAQGAIGYYVAEAIPEPALLSFAAGAFTLVVRRRRSA
jgi:hypothetical protein